MGGKRHIISIFVVLLLRIIGISGSDWLEGDFLIKGWTKKSRISRMSALTRQKAKVLCSKKNVRNKRWPKIIDYSQRLRCYRGLMDP
jgi:hypothetical protein